MIIPNKGETHSMMNIDQCMELLTSRHSVRHYIDKEVSKEDLAIIAKAGTYAPSAMNRQSWLFTITRNQALIAELAAAISTVLGREGYDMYQPKAIILTSNLKSNHNAPEDNACALQNMFLAAHSLGIGSVWINQFMDVCDVPEIRSFLNKLGIPENHAVYGTAALGYGDAPEGFKAEKLEENVEIID